MFRVYIPEPIPGLLQLPFLAPPAPTDNRLFQKVSVDAFRGFLHKTKTVREAQMLLIPHEYAHLKKHPGYLGACLEAAKAAGKPVLLSAYQDSLEDIVVPHSIVLRPSVRKSRLKRNEIVMPAYIEDEGGPAEALPVKSQRPKVGFAGKAGFPSSREYTKYVIKNYFLRGGLEREGIYFRRRALAALAADTRIELSALIRRTYSASRLTVEVPPEEARSSFLANIRETHFTLAPKGDGNYSLRFYEALSLSRIPILVDTDIALPLEDRIAYDAHMVRVPAENIDHLGDAILAFYALSEAELHARMRAARATFENYLHMPAFLSHVLTEDFLAKHLPT